MRKLFIVLLTFSLILNCFADFHDPFVRSFAPIRARIYREVCEGKITDKTQLYACFQEFRDRKLKISLKDVEYDIFVANIFCNMYKNKKFLLDFSEEEVIKELKKIMQKAIKEGSEGALLDLYSITQAPLAICIKAMQLVLTNTVQDCVRLRWTCEEIFGGQSEDVLRGIFGKEVDIPQDYPETDRGIFIPSPEKLELNNATLDRLTAFLDEKCKADPFYDVIKSSLESWRAECKD